MNELNGDDHSRIIHDEFDNRFGISRIAKVSSGISYDYIATVPVIVISYYVCCMLVGFPFPPNKLLRLQNTRHEKGSESISSPTEGTSAFSWATTKSLNKASDVDR